MADPNTNDTQSKNTKAKQPNTEGHGCRSPGALRRDGHSLYHRGHRHPGVSELAGQSV